MGKLYDVKLRVPAKHLTPLSQVIEPEGVLLSCEMYDPPPHTRDRNRNSIKQRTRMTGPKLVLHILSNGGDFSREQIRAKFIEQGFADTSHSPAISNCKKQKQITEVRPGWYRLTKFITSPALKIDAAH